MRKWDARCVKNDDRVVEKWFVLVDLRKTFSVSS